MTQAQAQEIARTLGKRHFVEYRSQKLLVVNVSRALAPGTPVSALFLSHDLNAPVPGAGGEAVPYRRVRLWVGVQ